MLLCHHRRHHHHYNCKSNKQKTSDNANTQHLHHHHHSPTAATYQPQHSYSDLNTASLLKTRSRMNDGRRLATKKNVVVRLFMELLMARDRITEDPRALGEQGDEMAPVSE